MNEISEDLETLLSEMFSESQWRAFQVYECTDAKKNWRLYGILWKHQDNFQGDLLSLRLPTKTTQQEIVIHLTEKDIFLGYMNQWCFQASEGSFFVFVLFNH